MSKKKSPSDDKAVDIGTIASAAVNRQFKNLLAKIKKGSITAAEMQVFNALEKRLKAENGHEEGVLYDKDSVAKHFKRTKATVYNWIREGMPVRPDGGYCLSDIHDWIESKKQSKKATKDDSSEYWQKEYKKFRARLSELELKIKRGEYIPKENVLTAFRELQSYVKKHMVLIPRTAPGKLAGLDPKDMQAVLTDITTAILSNMAKGQNASTLEAKLK